MDLHACTETLRDKVGDSSGLNATLKFDCGADGVVVHRRRSRCPTAWTTRNRDADCTITITLENLAATAERRAGPDHRLHDGQVQGGRAT